MVTSSVGQLYFLRCIYSFLFIDPFFLIIIDYSAGLLIEKEHNKKFWLLVSIIANISLLGIFKYFDFFVSNINEITGSDFVILNWILPIGLFFHTFQSMSYTIEVFYG